MFNIGKFSGKVWTLGPPSYGLGRQRLSWLVPKSEEYWRRARCVICRYGSETWCSAEFFGCRWRVVRTPRPCVDRSRGLAKSAAVTRRRIPSRQYPHPTTAAFTVHTPQFHPAPCVDIWSLPRSDRGSNSMRWRTRRSFIYYTLAHTAAIFYLGYYYLLLLLLLLLLLFIIIRLCRAYRYYTSFFGAAREVFNRVSASHARTYTLSKYNYTIIIIYYVHEQRAQKCARVCIGIHSLDARRGATDSCRRRFRVGAGLRPPASGGRALGSRSAVGVGLYCGHDSHAVSRSCTDRWIASPPPLCLICTRFSSYAAAAKNWQKTTRFPDRRGLTTLLRALQSVVLRQSADRFVSRSRPVPTYTFPSPSLAGAEYFCFGVRNRYYQL